MSELVTAMAPYKPLADWSKKDIIIQSYKILKREEGDDFELKPSVLKKYHRSVLVFAFLTQRPDTKFFVDAKKVSATTKNMLDRYSNIMGFGGEFQ